VTRFVVHNYVNRGRRSAKDNSYRTRVSRADAQRVLIGKIYKVGGKRVRVLDKDETSLRVEPVKASDAVTPPRIGNAPPLAHTMSLEAIQAELSGKIRGPLPEVRKAALLMALSKKEGERTN